MTCLCGHPYLSHESGECTEKGCPCAKWEEVADSPAPWCGIDVSESPDVSVTTIINTETGQFARMTEPVTLGSIRAIMDEIGPLDPAEVDRWVRGIFDFPAYATQGGGPIGDPFRNTIGGLSKKEWKP